MQDVQIINDPLHAACSATSSSTSSATLGCTIHCSEVYLTDGVI